MIKPEELAERYGLTPVNYNDPVDGSPVACIPWYTVYILLHEVETEVQAIKAQRHDGHVAIEKLERTLEAVRTALRNPYKRASLQNAIDVLKEIDYAVSNA